MLVPFFVIALVIARASGREGASELLGMRHPDKFRKAETISMHKWNLYTQAIMA